MSVSDKLAEIAALSLEERLELVEAIWDGIAADADGLEVPQWHRDEIRRRLAANRDDPRAGSSWEDIQARLLAEAEAEAE